MGSVGEKGDDPVVHGAWDGKRRVCGKEIDG